MLARRLGQVQDRLDPQPDPMVLAYARAVIEFGGHQPTQASVLRLAHVLASTSGQKRLSVPHASHALHRMAVDTTTP